MLDGPAWFGSTCVIDEAGASMGARQSDISVLVTAFPSRASFEESHAREKYEALRISYSDLFWEFRLNFYRSSPSSCFRVFDRRSDGGRREEWLGFRIRRIMASGLERRETSEETLAWAK